MDISQIGGNNPNKVKELELNVLSLQNMVDSVINSFANENGLSKVNVVELLQDFWYSKLNTTGFNSKYPSNPDTLPIIRYESENSHGNSPPFISYVFLPGGACFATYQQCDTKTEARRNAARIAFVHSLINSQPDRVITDEYIQRTIQETAGSFGGSVEDSFDSTTTLGAFRFMLRENLGKTLLEFQEMMTIFQLLHWNGSLKAMRERNCTRQEVMDHYGKRSLDDNIRSQMALDWITREHATPNIILNELKLTESELNEYRLLGKELRFPKEKRDILNLALSQTLRNDPHFESVA